MDRESKTPVAERQRPHVPTHQSRAGALARAPQHGARQIEPDDMSPTTEAFPAPPRGVRARRRDPRCDHQASTRRRSESGPRRDVHPHHRGGDRGHDTPRRTTARTSRSFDEDVRCEREDLRFRFPPAPGRQPRLVAAAFRKASGPSPCSVATCGSSTAWARPRRTSTPSRPMTRRHRSAVATRAGGSSTEISIRSAESSSS